MKLHYLTSFGVAIGRLVLAVPARRIKGTFKVEHDALPEMAAKFGDKQPLRNIQVEVSGKTGSALPWGS